MDGILKGIPDIYVYLDNILVATEDVQEQMPEPSLQETRQNGLAVSHKKCVLGIPELTYLEYHVMSEGITVLLEVVSAIWDFPAPDGPKAT